MEKKTYIKPDAVEILLEVEQIMSTSVFTPESGDDYEDNEAGVNKRRGTWGNLWAEE